MADDDYQPQTYQDDLSTDDNATDPVMSEEGENPAEEIGIPEDEFKDGIDGGVIDDEGIVDQYRDSDDVDEKDDIRERTEDMDEDDGTLPANEI